MARNAVQRWSVARLVAEVAEDPFVFSFNRPWMPWFGTGRCGCSEREQRPALWHRVANRAYTGEYLARLTNMSIIMASETTRTVAMAYVVGIGCPVYLHGWEDISVINGGDVVNGLIEQALLMFQDIRGLFSVVFFDKSMYFIPYLLSFIVIFD